MESVSVAGQAHRADGEEPHPDIRDRQHGPRVLRRQHLTHGQREAEDVDPECSRLQDRLHLNLLLGRDGPADRKVTVGRVALARIRNESLTRGHRPTIERFIIC